MSCILQMHGKSPKTTPTQYTFYDNNARCQRCFQLSQHSQARERPVPKHAHDAIMYFGKT